MESTTNINPKIQEWFSNPENVINVLSSASYNSYSFAYLVRKGTYDEYLTPEERENLECREEKWEAVLRKGGCIYVYVIEEDEDYPLDYNMLLVGASKLMEERPEMMKRIFNGEDDFYDNDSIIQYALFGELIYG